MRYLYIILLTISFSFASSAQTTSSPATYTLELIKNTPQWGFTLNSWTKGVNYQNPYGTIFSESSRMGFGAYINRKNIRTQINWGLGNYLDLDFQYYIWKGLNITLGSSLHDQNLEWQLDDYNLSNGRDDFRDLGSAFLFEHNASIGYAFVYKRLYVNIYAQAGYFYSEESECSYIVNERESNLRYKVTNKTELDENFTYGGGIEIEMLPYFPKFPINKEKGKGVASKLAFSMFLKIELHRNTNSNMIYDVTIDEWTDNNKVYHEQSNDYDIYPYDITVGLRWILGR